MRVKHIKSLIIKENGWYRGIFVPIDEYFAFCFIPINVKRK